DVDRPELGLDAVGGALEPLGVGDVAGDRDRVAPALAHLAHARLEPLLVARDQPEPRAARRELECWGAGSGRWEAIEERLITRAGTAAWRDVVLRGRSGCVESMDGDVWCWNDADTPDVECLTCADS